ncbi:hypothetical protein D3C86_1807430 [compost metagenome]
MGHQAIVVHTGVALVHRHGVLPVTLLNRPQSLGNQVESLLPFDRLPFAADLEHGLAQPVGVILDVLQGHSLGADMATTETIVGIAFDRTDAQRLVGAFGGFDGQATNGFTQVARTVVQSLGHGQPRSCFGRTAQGSRHDYAARPAVAPATFAA